jgi:HEAT repeat protein
MKKTLIFITLIIIASVWVIAGRREGSQESSPSIDKPLVSGRPLSSQARRLQNIAKYQSHGASEAFGLLVKQKVPGTFDILVSRLHDPRIFIRLMALKRLGKLGDPRAVQVLRQTMQSKYSSMVLTSVVAVGKLGPQAESLVDELATIYKRPHAPFQPDVPLSILHGNNGNNRNSAQVRIRNAVLWTLGQIATPKAIALLGSIYEHATTKTYQRSAANALGSAKAGDVLLALAKKNIHRTYAIDALGKCHYLPARNFLEGLLRDLSQPRAIRAALYSLGKIGNLESASAIRPFITSSDPKLVSAALWALVRVPQAQNLGPLMKFIQTASPNTKGLYSATYAVGSIQTPQAQKALRSLATHPSVSVRAGVCAIMGKTKDKNDIPLILKLYQSKQYYCAQSVFRNHMPAIRLPLIRALHQLLPNAQKDALIVFHCEHDKRKETRKLLMTHQPDFVAQFDVMCKKYPLQPDPSDLWWAKMPLDEVLSLLQKGDTKNTLPNLNRASLVLQFRKDPELQEEIIRWLDPSIKMPQRSRSNLFDRMRDHEFVSPKAVAMYRMYGLSDKPERSNAYACLFMEASDESIAIIAKRAIAGDMMACWFIGRSPDSRFIPTMRILAKRAIEKREDWLGGYIHCWPLLAEVQQYAKEVGSSNATYQKEMKKRISAAQQTPPEAFSF